MRNVSAQLEEKLFLTEGLVRNALFEIRDELNRIESQLFLIDFNRHDMAFQEFIDSVLEYQSGKMRRDLEDIERSIITKLQLTLRKSLDIFKRENNISASVTEKYAYSQEAILRMHYSRLSKVITLVDNMLLQSKIKMIGNNIRVLTAHLAEIIRGDVQKQWLRCTLTLAPCLQLRFEPDRDDLVSIPRTIFNHMLAEVLSPYMVLSRSKEFTEFRYDPGETMEITLFYRQVIEQRAEGALGLAEIEALMEKAWQVVEDQRH